MVIGWLSLGKNRGKLSLFSPLLEERVGKISVFKELNETNGCDLLLWHLPDNFLYGDLYRNIERFKAIPSIFLTDFELKNRPSYFVTLPGKSPEKIANEIISIINSNNTADLRDPLRWKEIFSVIFEHFEARDALERELFKTMSLTMPFLKVALYKGYLDWSVVFLSEGIQNIVGYTKEEFNSGKIKWKDLILQEDLAEAKAIFKESIEKKRREYFRTYRIVTSSGDIRWIHDRGVFIRDDSGNLIFTYGVIADVTEERLLFTQVESAKRELEVILDSMPNYIIMLNGDLSIQRLNKPFGSFFKAHPRDLVGKKCFELFGKNHFCHVTCFWDRIRAGGEVLETNEVFIEDMGGYFNVISVPILRGKEISKILCVYTDIAKLRETQRYLATISEELSFIIELIEVILIAVDEKGNIFRWNRIAERVFRLKASDVLEKPLKTLNFPGEFEKILKAYEICKNERKVINLSEVRIYYPDSGTCLLELTFTPFYKKNGSMNIFITGFDITERKNLEMMLVHAQKLESIGALAAGVAHEINTPLQCLLSNIFFVNEVVQDLLKLAKNKGLEDHSKEVDASFLIQEVPSALEQSLLCVNKIKKIVDSIREFSHPGSTDKVFADIHKILEGVCTLSTYEWKHVAEIETDFDKTIPPVPCYQDELGQVFLNIIVNGAQAIRGKLGDRPETKGRIKITTRRKGSSWCEVKISDTGVGIPKAIQHKIFEPFFTTKPVGMGTGQGLAIAQSIIIKKHGGQIYFESEEGKGTTFTILLPLGEEGIGKI